VEQVLVKAELVRAISSGLCLNGRLLEILASQLVVVVEREGVEGWKRSKIFQRYLSLTFSYLL
jgi:hypothetical protein